MKRAATAALSIIFLLSQAAASYSAVTADNSVLNPPSRLTNNFFRQMCGTILTAFDIYKMDAVQRMKREDILRALGGPLSIGEVRFDLERADPRNRGWTRYYHVEIDGCPCIARVFLSSERSYQDRVEVIERMEFADPAVTVEIFRISDNLERIRPLRLDPASPADRSS